MTTIYVVTYSSWDYGPAPEEAFTNKADAEAVAAASPELDVEEIELDAASGLARAARAREGWARWEVEFDPDGNVTTCGRMGEETNDPSRAELRAEGWVSADCTARSEEQAVGIAADARRALLAREVAKLQQKIRDIEGRV